MRTGQREAPEPRRGAAGKKTLSAAALLLAAAVAAVWYLGWVRPAARRDVAETVARKVLFYRHPMNPAITSPTPAKDEMGMDYVPVYTEEAGPPPKSAQQQAEEFFAEEKPGAPKKERKALFYRNPMNPAITSPTPAKDEMGMDYVPVYEEEAAPLPGGVPGLASVSIAPEGIRLAGVITAPAVRGKLKREVRAVGSVMADETRLHRVTLKVEGWVEKLHVNFSGQLVKRGEPVLDLYSPELLAGQEEYLRARETAARLAASNDPETRASAERLAASTRRRLELFNVPPSFIEALEREGRSRRTVTFTAPASGYVVAKEVLPGQKVEPGMELYSLADLSRVWIEADIYEFEARDIAVGVEALLSLPFDPGKDFRVRVAYVQPTLDSESRTLRVRFEVPNQGAWLKPGMYLDVLFFPESGEGVVIPDSAVMDTGTRRVVFVEKGGGLFEPREVQVGARGGGKALILSGVAEGERVVIRANFLLDSESRLRAVIESMTKGASQGGGHQAAP